MVTKSRCPKTKAFESIIRSCGKKIRKTMFPKNWRPTEVLDNAIDALRNVKEVEFLKRNNRIRYLGQSNSGFTIEFITELDGTIVTFYPKL